MKQILRIFLGAAVATILLQSCSQSPTNVVDKQGKTLELKVLTQNADAQLNYCFYLPDTYNGKDKIPVLFFLDPHADAKTPLTLYGDLANKYNYIFIGSNSMRNGLSADETTTLFNAMVAEAKHRFEVDEKRMFVAGFSGGAKVALLIAQQNTEIIGAAACGGSMPLGSAAPNFYLSGLVGNTDFNYLEMQQTYTAFGQNGIDYTSVVFTGGHQWPDAQSFEMALIGFNLFAMKSKRAEKDNEWLDMVWNKMQDSIKVFGERNDFENQNRYLNQSARWFYGLRNTTELSQQSARIEKSAEFAEMVKKRQKLIQTEVKLRSEYIRAIELKDLTWWNTEIKSITANIKSSDKEVALVSQRLMNYLSMASFMLTKTDLDDAKIDDSLKKIKIYQLVDPNNADVYLMFARYYMLLNDTDNMKQSYLKAKELGFNQYETYKKEKSWAKLLNNTDIVALQ